jgi:hypothetical protein
MSTVSARRGLIAVAIAILLAALMPATAAGAVHATRFELSLGNSCIDGYSTEGARVHVFWRSSGGVVKADVSLRASSDDGFWEVCSNRELKIGDVIRATVGSAVHRLVVPRLTLVLDRVNDVFKGRAPAGSAIVLNYAAGLFIDSELDKRVRVGSDGTWRYQPAGFDIVGGLDAFIRWTSKGKDTVTTDAVAPFLRVTLGSASFKGSGKPDGNIKVTLRDPSTTDVVAVGKAVASAGGTFKGQFRTADGSLFPLGAGYRLSALSIAADARWIVPRITGSASAATDVVTGRCYDAGTSADWYWVDVIAGDGSIRGFATGDTSANGSFQIDFGSDGFGQFFVPANVRSGDTIVVRCLQRTGDWVQRRFAVP